MDQQEYIMSIDQGTTSSRAVLINKKGQIIASGQEEFPQYYPKNGWVEQDPEEIWQSVQSVISEVFIKSGIHPDQVVAIGITNQRETSLIWDRQSGRPIYPAIVWQSRQTADICLDLIDQGYSDFFQERTGLMIDAYFSATKVRWILDRVEGAQAKAEEGDLCFGTVDTWLLWKLTGGKVHATDYTNASRTMLFNIHNLAWDQEILDLLKIPQAILPEVKSNSEIYGYTDGFQFFGKKVPITAMAGDQQAALFGHLAFEPGMAKSTYGTGAFIVMNTGKQVIQSQHQLLSTIAYAINNEVTYGLEGSIFVAGSAVQWLRDGLEFFDKSSESEKLALESDSQDEIYLVPAFTGLGAPYWDSSARGTIFGLTRATNQADITKATLQAIAYQVKDIVDTMEIDSGISIPQLRVDGGASLNNYLLQFQADILDRPIYRTRQLETTALGIGYLAGLALGYWQDLDELKSLQEDSQKFKPEMAEDKRQQLYGGWKKAVKATQAYARLLKD